jgi:S-adenosylmethionine-diacylgycerolhomoserine-N-methlytransferase
MDRLYRRQRHFYDLTRKHYLLGRDQLIEGLGPPSGSRVLEIGCGTARNLCRRPPGRRCSSSASTSRPRCWIRRAASSARRLAARIELARGDTR